MNRPRAWWRIGGFVKFRVPPAPTGQLSLSPAARRSEFRDQRTPAEGPLSES